ncbi:MAG: Ig-like domain-containing protein [Planctomycetota bacterium]|nr:Ig-like domain-containing protein [Planctomycetota bacterium]
MQSMRFAAAPRTTNGIAGRSTTLLAALGLTALSACSGSSSSEFSGDLFIRSCSIGCTDGSDGRVVTCAVVNVTENQEISILFSEPIDPTSVTPSSLQVINTANGTAPDGLRLIDPLDQRRVIFRPSIAFNNGGISFAFEPNQTYELLIPGANQGDSGPFIRSISGNPNRSRLSCSVQTTEGIADIVPGNPAVQVEVDVVTSFDGNGEPLTTERRPIQDANGNPAVDVSRFSGVYFAFNELMFLPTVADNSTGLSPFIRVQFDRDGSLATAGSERFDIPGSYEVFVDEISLTTSLVFTPIGTIPSAGSDPLNPSLLVVRIPTEVTDAAGNPVTVETGGGVLAGIPEVILFDELTLPDGPEDFSDNDFEDQSATGAVWADGLLAPGVSGGSGRHGELRVLEGDTVTLNTDSQSFPQFAGVSQIDVIGNGSGTAYPTSLTVTDGVFEFSKLIVEPGGRLIFEGGNAARILVRGSCVIGPNSIIDLSGTSPGEHNSLILAPQMGDVTPAAGGPGGGAGGLGADRSNLGSEVPDFRNLAFEDAVQNPGANRDGLAGEGVGGGAIGGGSGGERFPVELPTGITVQNDAIQNTLGDTGFNVSGDPLVPTDGDRCLLQMLAGPGAGGAYSLDGGQGSALPVGLAVTENPAGRPVVGPVTAGGSNAGLALAPPSPNNDGYGRRLLRWQDGNLQGGSGGGGGGNHPYGSRATSQNGGTPGPTPDQCLSNFGSFLFSNYDRWLDHSGAQGGGGGGAVEFTMGRSFELDGTIDVSGGDGASATSILPNNAGSFAVPGGGGSGGAIRIRAKNVDLGGNARINVLGGLGGAAPWSLNSMATITRGGDGSPGLVRIEDDDDSGLVSFNSLAARIQPFDSGNVAGSLDFFSYAPNFFDANSAGARRPDSLSGGTSCWMRPVGSFVSLEFPDDSGTALEDMGWTMDLVIFDGAGGEILRPYRGTNAQFQTSWETQYGNLLGYDLGPGESASPIVVRFQGARALVADLDDPALGLDKCDIDLTNPQAGVVALESVTPWVSHPSDLNEVLTPDNVAYTVNMIRYCIIFDATNFGADQPGLILRNEAVLGVDNLAIRAQPE